MEHTTRDVSGRLVRERDKVRVLSIDESFLKTLEPEDQLRVRSMIGDVLVVDEVNEYGNAMAEKCWRTGPDTSISHAVALSGSEFELIESAS